MTLRGRAASLFILVFLLGLSTHSSALDILVSREHTTFSKNFPDIAINPIDHRHIVAVYEQDTVACGFSISRDGGASFVSSSLPRPVFPGASINPSVAFDADGTAFVVCRRADPFQSYIAVSRIAPGSNSPDPEFVLTNGPNAVVGTADPLIAADASDTSPFKNRIYVTWAAARSTVQPISAIHASHSVDGGTTFSTPITIASVEPPAGFGRSALTIGPDGTVYVPIWHRAIRVPMCCSIPPATEGSRGPHHGSSSPSIHCRRRFPSLDSRRRDAPPSPRWLKVSSSSIRIASRAGVMCSRRSRLPEERHGVIQYESLMTRPGRFASISFPGSRASRPPTSSSPRGSTTAREKGISSMSGPRRASIWARPGVRTSA